MRPSTASSRLNAVRALTTDKAVFRVAATNALAGTHIAGPPRMSPHEARIGVCWRSDGPGRRQKKPRDGRHPAAMKISRYEYPANSPN